MNNVINMAQSREKLTKAAFDLSLWREGGRTNFTNQLFDLIAKADSSNKNRLRIAFPVEVSIFEEWQRTGNEARFFEKWGVK